MLLTSRRAEPERGDPLLVHVDVEAGDVGQFAEANRRELGVGRGGGEQLVARILEVLLAHAVRVQQFHGEAGRIAEAADRARHQREDLRITKAAEGGGRALDDGVGGVLRALALIVVGEVDVGLAAVLAAGAAAAAGDDEKVFTFFLSGPCRK